jgi:hypothetical protein
MWERRPRARRGSGCSPVGIALTILLLLVAAFLLERVNQILFAPWAMAPDGGPTLTGTWVGPLRSQWGPEYYLSLDLQWKPPSFRGSRGVRSRSRANLTGEARICNQAGKEFRLAVSGGADRDAQDVRVDAEARESQYRESLPLRGAWHGETLELSAFTTPFGPEGELRGGRATVSSSTTDAAGRFVELYPSDLKPDQVPSGRFPEITLRKGDDAAFRTGCDAIRR